MDSSQSQSLLPLAAATATTDDKMEIDTPAAAEQQQQAPAGQQPAGGLRISADSLRSAVKNSTQNELKELHDKMQALAELNAFEEQMRQHGELPPMIKKQRDMYQTEIAATLKLGKEHIFKTMKDSEELAHIVAELMDSSSNDPLQTVAWKSFVLASRESLLDAENMRVAAQTEIEEMLQGMNTLRNENTQLKEEIQGLKRTHEEELTTAAKQNRRQEPTPVETYRTPVGATQSGTSSLQETTMEGGPLVYDASQMIGHIVVDMDRYRRIDAVRQKSASRWSQLSLRVQSAMNQPRIPAMSYTE